MQSVKKNQALSLDIAKREKALLDTIHYEDGYSLYIGIPFCPTTCLYCSFTSYPIAMWKKRVQDYLEAVYKEMQFVADAYKDKILDTVYIGGGTPTTLEAGQLDWLLTKLKNTSFDWVQVKRIHRGSRTCRQHYTREAGSTASAWSYQNLGKSPDNEG